MKIDWVWYAERAGWFISIDWWSFGPMKFKDMFRLSHWLVREALLEPDEEARRRMLVTFEKVKDVRRGEWDRLLAKAQICTLGNDLYCFKITRDMF
jgi:hypothetical protein